MSPPVHTPGTVSVFFNNEWVVVDRPDNFFDLKVRLLNRLKLSRTLVPAQLKLLDYTTGKQDTPSKLTNDSTAFLCVILEDGVYSSDYENADMAVTSSGTKYVMKESYLSVAPTNRNIISIDTMIARDYLQKRGAPLGSKFNNEECLIFCAPTVVSEIQGAVERKEIDKSALVALKTNFQTPPSDLTNDRFNRMYDEFYSSCLADRPTSANDNTSIKLFPKTRAALEHADRVVARKYENDFRIFVESLTIARQYYRICASLDRSLTFVSRNQTHIQALYDSMWASTRDRVFGTYFGREELTSCHIRPELL